MKRKVVQHGPSTLIVSLPAKWAKKNGINRGRELDVEVKQNQLIISTEEASNDESMDLDVSPYGIMIPRMVHVLHKKGIDEMRLSYNNPNAFYQIQSALDKREAMGLELLEAGTDHCVIKNVSEGSRDFGQVLRQTFLLLMSMAEDGYAAMSKRNFEQLKNIVTLEKANNRLTTLLRRHINKYGAKDPSTIGPLYYIVELLEKVADEYKYFYQYFSTQQKIKVHPGLLAEFKSTNDLLRDFYNMYYKFTPKDVANIKLKRGEIVANLITTSKSLKESHDIICYQHIMSIVTDIFSMVDPFLITVLKSDRKEGPEDRENQAA